MRNLLSLLLVFSSMLTYAQVPVDLKEFDKKKGVKVTSEGALLHVEWPAGNADFGKIIIDLSKGKPVINSLLIGKNNISKTIAKDLDPAIILTVGKRDLFSQNGWNIFFDKTAYLPYKTYPVTMDKSGVKVVSAGSQTEIIVSGASAGPFSGSYNFTLYNGSPLMNVAAVMATDVDSLAVVYDAGLVSEQSQWKNLFWSDTENNVRNQAVVKMDTANMMAVKYRTIIGEGNEGSLAVFPGSAPVFLPAG